MSGWDNEATRTYESGPSDPTGDTEGTIDVVYRREVGREAFADGAWRAVDICTRNRIYGLDTRLRCIAVIDRVSGHTQPEHQLLGASLVGGQKRDSSGGTIVSHPLPEAGMAAVFELPEDPNRPRYIETSVVVRVIFRQRLVRVDADGPQPSWHDISGRSPGG